MTILESIEGDITELSCDVIVNAANSRLLGGGGVDGAIHAAGGPQIMEECKRWLARHGHLPTGEAMMTGSGALPCLAVIHTVGPVWSEHTPVTADALLARCYRSSLEVAANAGHRSIAFPGISTGVYGFPKDRAAAIAVQSVKESPHTTRLDVITFVCFDRVSREIYEELLSG